ncbi:MAG: hypothetical protein CMJ64_03855 [Planctomycetaceae bacterium]|nr:hypothetical protein [Planctomycetaceae bacterium]
MFKLSTLVPFLLLLAVPAVAQPIDTQPQFQHLPLQYHGPDPTSGYFLPASTPFESEPSRFAQLPPPSEVVPELLNYPDTTFETIPPGPGTFVGDPRFGGPVIGDPAFVTQHISKSKDGFFQKVSFTGTYIDRGSIGSFGLNELDLSATVAVPAPTRKWPLLITPAFNVRYLDGPVEADLPAQLYETYVDFLWVPRITDRWTAIVGVAPSLYTDFDGNDGDAFRVTGKGLVRYDWLPEQVQVIAGVLYLDRDDVRLLPAGGIIWKPTPDKDYEILFPRPKLAHRITVGHGYEDWLYIGGEFGGNTWTVRRAGVAENITLRDFRALLGLERRKNGGAGYRIEVGYVFSREIEFASGLPDALGDDTALVRGGVTF